MREFAPEQRVLVHDLQGDPDALGAAVTVELCGHWEHDGPCRWPHHTSATPVGDNSAYVQVRFDADESEVDEVRRRILAGLRVGALQGPDDHITAWGPVEPA